MWKCRWRQLFCIWRCCPSTAISIQNALSWNLMLVFKSLLPRKNLKWVFQCCSLPQCMHSNDLYLKLFRWINSSFIRQKPPILANSSLRTSHLTGPKCWRSKSPNRWLWLLGHHWSRSVRTATSNLNFLTLKWNAVTVSSKGYAIGNGGKALHHSGSQQ
jgi:hypothetical protein